MPEEAIEMRPNRFKQVLAEGRVPVGHMVLEFGTRGMPQLLEETGVDFVVVDMEHSGFTMADIADMMAWFKLTTVASFVRVPQIEYHFIARSLDAGALGIMIPDVQDAAEARAIVDAAKYAPLGKRGVAIGTANTDFKRVAPGEFMNYANENTTVICQIESQEGLDHVEDIASTAGVDVLWVGQFDLSNSLGIAGQFQHPKFVDALKLVVDTAHEHGLVACIQPGNMAQAREWMEIGFNAISYNGDLTLYVDALTQAVEDIRKLAGGL
jgi:2-dehydro-3-deoxyglucarate aldolase/4-hydroxy-2-oxoheptanedioate aldolase